MKGSPGYEMSPSGMERRSRRKTPDQVGWANLELDVGDFVLERAQRPGPFNSGVNAAKAHAIDVRGWKTATLAGRQFQRGIGQPHNVYEH